MRYVGILGLFRQTCRAICGDQFGQIQHGRNFASDRLLPSWHESTVCFRQGSYVEFIQKYLGFFTSVGYTLGNWNLHYAHVGERTEVISQ